MPQRVPVATPDEVAFMKRPLISKTAVCARRGWCFFSGHTLSRDVMRVWLEYTATFQLTNCLRVTHPS